MIWSSNQTFWKRVVSRLAAKGLVIWLLRGFRESGGGGDDVESDISITACVVTVEVSMPWHQNPCSREVPLKVPPVRSPGTVFYVCYQLECKQRASEANPQGGRGGGASSSPVYYKLTIYLNCQNIEIYHSKIASTLTPQRWNIFAQAMETMVL